MSQLSEALQVDDLAVDRSVVDLKVARVNNKSRGSSDRDGIRVCDTVVNSYELDLECVSKSYPLRGSLPACRW